MPMEIHNASRQHIGLHGTPAWCTLQFVRRCDGLRGIWTADSILDSNAKNRFAGP